MTKNIFDRSNSGKRNEFFMTIISYAQNFEDIILWRVLSPLVTQGFYIDIGAFDATVDSVSRLFYDHGWRGIHVEPIKEFAENIRKDRPDEVVLDVAVTDKGGFVTLYAVGDNTGLSTTKSHVADIHHSHDLISVPRKVAAVTLDQIFNSIEVSDVHWLKIDVEGAERDVLKGWIQSSVRPWVVVIESTRPLSPEVNHQDWEDLIFDRGYVLTYFDGLNRYYCDGARGDLIGGNWLPPNVFDDFTLSGLSSESVTKHMRVQVQALNDQIELANAKNLELGIVCNSLEALYKSKIDQVYEEKDTLLEQVKCREAEIENNYRNNLSHLNDVNAENIYKISVDNNLKIETLVNAHKENIDNINRDHDLLIEEIQSQIKEERYLQSTQIDGLYKAFLDKDKELSFVISQHNEYIDLMDRNHKSIIEEFRSQWDRERLLILLQHQNDFTSERLRFQEELMRSKRDAELALLDQRTCADKVVSELNDQLCLSNIELVNATGKVSVLDERISAAEDEVEALRKELAINLMQSEALRSELQHTSEEYRAYKEWSSDQTNRIFQIAQEMKNSLDGLRRSWVGKFTAKDMRWNVAEIGNIGTFDNSSLLPKATAHLIEKIPHAEFRNNTLISEPSQTIQVSIMIHHNDLAGLLLRPGREFIETAYISLLGREADVAGMNAYLHFLRGGGSKMFVLVQIASSAEARERKLRTTWLKGASRRCQIARIPILRDLVSLIRPIESCSIRDSHMRAIEFKLEELGTSGPLERLTAKIDGMDRQFKQVSKSIADLSVEVVRIADSLGSPAFKAAASHNLFQEAKIPASSEIEAMRGLSPQAAKIYSMIENSAARF